MTSPDERAELLGAVRDLSGTAGIQMPQTCNLVAEEIIATWPTKTMRRIVGKAEAGEVDEAVQARRVIAAKALETLEARWEKGGEGLAVSRVLAPVVVSLIRIWLCSEDARQCLLRVKRKILVDRRSKKNKK